MKNKINAIMATLLIFGSFVTGADAKDEIDSIEELKTEHKKFFDKVKDTSLFKDPCEKGDLKELVSHCGLASFALGDINKFKERHPKLDKEDSDFLGEVIVMTSVLQENFAISSQNNEDFKLAKKFIDPEKNEIVLLTRMALQMMFNFDDITNYNIQEDSCRITVRFEKKRTQNVFAISDKEEKSITFFSYIYEGKEPIPKSITTKFISANQNFKDGKWDTSKDHNDIYRLGYHKVVNMDTSPAELATLMSKIASLADNAEQQISKIDQL